MDKVAAARGTARAEFVRQRAHRDELGYEHARFQQTFKGVKVFGGESIVHTNPAGKQIITDDFRQGIRLGDVTPTLSESAATSKAVGLRGGSKKLTAKPESELVIYRGKDGKDKLTYKVQLRQEDGTAQTSMPVYFIDAKTGETVFSYDNLQTGAITGTLKTLYYGSPTGNTYQHTDGQYVLEDHVRKVATYDLRQGTTTQNHFFDTDNVWGTNTTSSSLSFAATAHYAAEKTYDYFKNVHGRNGIDGNGGPLKNAGIDGTTRFISSGVHYGSGYNNAFWNGSQMLYGDGDGKTFLPFMSLDIAGHEMAHGVIQHSAGLIYSGESGALNESWADVFGVMVELYADGNVESADTWKIGEDIYTPTVAGDAIRYFDNPHSAINAGYTSDDHPDHYAERYTGSSDNGGVHINSSIGNKVFYLVAKGGTHHRSNVTVKGIGTADAAKIWYKALTSYMTSSTNFAGAKTATLNAATALFGETSAQYTAVSQAWTACGI